MQSPSCHERVGVLRFQYGCVISEFDIQFPDRVGFNESRIGVPDTPKMPTLGPRLQKPFDRAIVSNLTVQLRPNSQDMCPRYVKTSRNTRIRILEVVDPTGSCVDFLGHYRLLSLETLLDQFKCKESYYEHRNDLTLFGYLDNAPRVSGTPEPCGVRIAAQIEVLSLRPARNAARMDLVSPGPARIAAQIEVYL
ncbi:unnamed protein product [Prunus armeniaca]